jgi:type IV pilus assembly protein PilW
MNHRHRYEAGVTIVELMVAMTIGLLISLVLGTIFVQSSRAHAEDDRYTRMIENGRFALEQVAGDLRMVSFWAEMLDPGAITTALTAGEDCGIGVFNGASAVLYNNPHASPPTVQFDVTASGCAALLGSVRSGTAQLAVKHASGLSLTSGMVDGTLYLRSNGTSGSLIDDAASNAAPASFKDWQYMPSVYYIGDAGGMPRLCRLQLTGGAFSAVSADDCLANGVEQLHVQFGIDTDGDGTVNQYKSAPTAAEMASALTARVYILVRSETTDPAYHNNKTYRLGDLDVAGGGDGYYRRVFSSTVKLRNPANLAAFK